MYLTNIICRSKVSKNNIKKHKMVKLKTNQQNPIEDGQKPKKFKNSFL